MKPVKALTLLSGGLDSMLAAKILQIQGIEVVGLSFLSHFFSAEKARRSAKELGINLKEVDFSEEHLAMVKNPPHGYGKNLNPCIDCHGLMLKKAEEIRERENYNFVATGEVLGQRPMSQNKDALELVARISGLNGRLLRPLSAKLLSPSKPELNGLVKREKLLDISGRGRQRQMELAAKYGLKEYATPAGGCLLTDAGFCERLLKMFEYWPDCRGEDIELLKNGRIFWLDFSGKSGIIKTLMAVGRRAAECQTLERLAKSGDILLELKDIAGPTTLIRIKGAELDINERKPEIAMPAELKMSELKLGEAKNETEILKTAALLTGYYASKARGREVKITQHKTHNA